MGTFFNFLGFVLITFCNLGYPMAFAEAPSKPLSDFPKSDLLWLTMEEGVIEPSQNKNYSSLSDDNIIFLKKHGSQLTKGTPWAIINKEDLVLSERKINLERAKAAKQLRNISFKQEDESDKKRIALESLKSKKQQLLDAQSDDLIPNSLKDKILLAIEKMDAKIASHEAQLDPESLTADLENAKEEILLELERKELNFRKIEKRSTLKAEFDGTLELYVENAATAHESEKGYWPASGTLYASITDTSHYTLKISTRSSALNVADPNKLTAKLQDTGQRKMVLAHYSARTSSTLSSGVKEHHLFKLEKDQAHFAENNLGDPRSVYIYYRLDFPCHIVPKKKIALLAPDILEKKGWSGLVSHLFPGAQLVRTGPTTLAVKAPDGN